MKKGYYVMAFVLIAVVTSPILFYVYVRATTTNSPVGTYSNAEEYSYLIYTDGTNYYTKDGASGLIVDYNTDASVVINDAIQNIGGSGGGMIFFRRGEYRLTAPIILNQAHVTLMGEGEKSVLFEPNSSSLVDLIKIYSPSINAYCDSVAIRGLTFYNPWVHTYNITGAIYIQLNEIVWFLTIENCQFLNVNAVYTNAVSSPLCLQHSQFRDLLVQIPTDYAFKIYSAIDLTLDNIWIDFSNFRLGTCGLYLQSNGSSGVTIENFRCFHGDFGIYINNSSDTRVANSICDFASIGYEILDSDRCQFVNCYAHAPNNLGYGFHIKGNSNNTVITNCQAINCKGQLIPSIGKGFFSTESYSNCIQSFIGCNGAGSTTPYGIQSSDRVRGCVDIADRGDCADVAVTNIKCSKTVVGQGYNCMTNVSVVNVGDFTETFNVTLYANTTVVGIQIMNNLPNGTSSFLNFAWNTAGFAYGNYTISAYACPVPGETITADNNLTDGTEYVGIPGDINGDGTVNVLDAIILGNAFNSKPGDPNWNPNADINSDGIVNILDSVILGNHFGQHYP